MSNIVDIYKESAALSSQLPTALLELGKTMNVSETNSEGIRKALLDAQALELNIGLMYREAKRRLAAAYREKIIELHKDEFYKNLTADEKKEYLRAELADEKSLVELCGDLQKMASTRVSTCQSILNSINTSIKSGVA